MRLTHSHSPIILKTSTQNSYKTEQAATERIPPARRDAEHFAGLVTPLVGSLFYDFIHLCRKASMLELVEHQV